LTKARSQSRKARLFHTSILRRPCCLVVATRHLLGLCGLNGALVEEATEERVEEGVEDDLGTASLGKGHPQDEDELEGVVEGEPVDGVDSALENGQEGVGDPVGQPVGVIGLALGEQSLERVVAGDEEASKVDEELAGNVEEDEEEVESTETEDDVDLGDGALLLQVVEGRVFGQLLVELRNVLLGAFLERHFLITG